MDTVLMLKKKMRAIINARASFFSPHARKRLSLSAAECLFASPLYQRARLILAYMPLKGEFDSLPIIRQALADKKALALPRVEACARRLDFMLIPHPKDLSQSLVRGSLGIWEPTPSLPFLNICDMDRQTLILVPGLAFSKEGLRLGRGAGYYDRFLSLLSPDAHRIGCALPFQILPHIPHEGHDKRLTWLLTSLSLIPCPKPD